MIELRCFTSPSGTVVNFVDEDCKSLVPVVEPMSGQVHFYPNPVAAGGMLYFDWPERAPATTSIFTLFDVTGEMVAQINGQGSMSIIDIPPGLYFWEMRGSQGWVGSGRVVVGR